MLPGPFVSLGRPRNYAAPSAVPRASRQSPHGAATESNETRATSGADSRLNRVPSEFVPASMPAEVMHGHNFAGTDSQNATPRTLHTSGRDSVGSNVEAAPAISLFRLADATDATRLAAV